MTEDENVFPVKFTGQALKDFREIWPDLPPGDEILMTIKLGSCHICGLDMKESEIGGIDPTGITEEGELTGEFFCQNCMEKGH